MHTGTRQYREQHIQLHIGKVHRLTYAHDGAMVFFVA